jgi:hypothetical protein
MALSELMILHLACGEENGKQVADAPGFAVGDSHASVIRTNN